VPPSKQQRRSRSPAPVFLVPVAGRYIVWRVPYGDGPLLREGPLDPAALTPEGVARCRAAWARLIGRQTCVVHGNPNNPDNVRTTANRVALIDRDGSHVDVPDLDLVLPHNAAGLDDGAHDIDRASVGRMGSRRLLGRRVRNQAACRSSSGLSSGSESRYHTECRTPRHRSRPQREHRCAVGAYHGSWERPDNGFADMVLASAAKGDAPDFEMPEGTGNDSGEVSSSGHPTSRNTTPATAPSATPHDDERARQGPLFPVMAKPSDSSPIERSASGRDCRRRTEKRRSNGPSDSQSAACRQRVCAAFSAAICAEILNDETLSWRR
jgi:hypothetical protein